MESLPSLYAPKSISEETTPEIENLHHVSECCDNRSTISDNKIVKSSVIQPNMPFIGHEDLSFVQPLKCNIPKSTALSEENRNSLSYMNHHKTVVLSDGGTPNEALESIFKMRDSTYDSQEECNETDDFENSSDFEGIKRSSTSNILHSESDSLLLSSNPNPSLNKNDILVPKQIKKNNVEENFCKNGTTMGEKFISLENVNTTYSSEGSNQLMVHHVSSTSDMSIRENKLGFSILKNILLGGDYYPPYLPKTLFTNHFVTTDDKRVMISPPKYDELRALALKDQITSCQTSNRGVEYTFVNESSRVSPSEKTCEKNENENSFTNTGTTSGTISKRTIYLPAGSSQGTYELPLIRLMNNVFDNTFHNKTENTTEVVTNTSTSSVSNAIIKVQTNQLNLISTFAEGSLMTVSKTSNKFDALQEKREINFTHSDQTVPINMTVAQQVVPEIGLNKSPNKTVSLRTRTNEYLNLPSNLFSSSGLGDDNNRIDSFDNDYLTNDCDETISPDLLPIFFVKRKTVIEESFGLYKSNDVQLPYKVIKDSNVTNHRFIENSSTVSASEIKTANETPTTSGIISNRIVIPEQSKTSIGFNEEAGKLNKFDYNNLFDISNSSWPDINLIKENVNIAEKTLNKAIELQSLTGGGDVDFAESASDDELDRVIDDSIKKYENFAVDASVLATPSTAEKSCQTEIKKLARCKRCLEFEDQSPESKKKRKPNSIDETDIVFPAMINVTDSFNDSSAVINYDIHNGNRIPSATERERVNLFNSSANNENYLAINSADKFSELDTPKTDDVDDEGSLFDAEDRPNEEHDQLKWSDESSFDSDQEVPINLHANQDMEYEDSDIVEETDSSSETEYFEALENLRNARKL